MRSSALTTTHSSPLPIIFSLQEYPPKPSKPSASPTNPSPTSKMIILVSIKTLTFTSNDQQQCILNYFRRIIAFYKLRIICKCRKRRGTKGTRRKRKILIPLNGGDLHKIISVPKGFSFNYPSLSLSNVITQPKNSKHLKPSLCSALQITVQPK